MGETLWTFIYGSVLSGDDWKRNREMIGDGGDKICRGTLFGPGDQASLQELASCLKLISEDGEV